MLKEGQQRSQKGQRRQKDDPVGSGLSGNWGAQVQGTDAVSLTEGLGAWSKAPLGNHPSSGMQIFVQVAKHPVFFQHLSM